MGGCSKSSAQRWFVEGRDLGSSFAPLSRATFTVGTFEAKCVFLPPPSGITATCSALNVVTSPARVAQPRAGCAAPPARTNLAARCAQPRWDLARKHTLQDPPREHH